MVIVDSSVWIGYFSGRENAHTVWLDHEIAQRRVGLTDLILCEVLQGARSNASFQETYLELSEYELFISGGEELAILSAQNYRLLRSKGTTVRTTVDCLIATLCLAYGHSLLHRDRDFDSFEKYLGLKVVKPFVH